MKEDKYSLAAVNLCKAIDIAIESFKKYTPKSWNKEELNDFIIFYLDCKERIENPKPEYRNMQSFKYVYPEVITYFQESTGDEVNEFWNKIKENDLPFKRENKVAKILKRKKINNDIEYDFVTDVIVPYQQEGLINDEEAILLKQYIGDFENKKNKK